MIDVNQVKEIIRRFEEREGVRGVIQADYQLKLICQ